MGEYQFACGAEGESQVIVAGSRAEAHNLCLSDFGSPCTYIGELSDPENAEESSLESGETTEPTQA